jgi:hypothetical protein
VEKSGAKPPHSRKIMNRCIAYRPVPGCRRAWMRCAHKALPGLDFCRSHMKAIRGTLIGLIMHVCPPSERSAARTTSSATPSPTGKSLVN